MKLVFIHFGEPPSHLVANILDVCQRFPDKEVVLVADFSIKELILLRNYSEEFVDTSRVLNFFQGSSSLPLAFRGGFWLLSLIRLIVLADYVEANNCKVLHVESDVVLASDFPFHFFLELDQKIAFARVSNSEAIASTIYLPSPTSARHFRNALYDEFNRSSDLTDMKFLSLYSDNFPDHVLELPSSLNDDMSTEFIFDGSDYGQFLFGTDPRNLRGIKVLNFDNPNTRIGTGALDYIYNQSRDFIDVSDGFLSKKLVSIHVHSKNLKLFKDTTRREESVLACSRTNRGEIRIIVPKIFLIQFRLAIRKRIVRLFKNEE